tara:strand:- start:25861 stop:26565 length:705 start_codon:yes stop_codon:yes gene_type:complete
MIKIKKNTFIAIVLARKGSKSIKNKNLFKVNRKPLIQYTFEEAVKSKLLSSVILSTDDNKIINLSKKFNIMNFGLRPKNLSSDKAKSIDAIIHTLSKIKDNLPEFIVLLQPTSPLRKSYHIDVAIKKMIKLKKNYDSLVSLEKIEEPHPYKMKFINNGKVVPFIKDTSSEIARQLLPAAYKLNGAIYISKTKILLSKKTLLYRAAPYVMNCDELVNIDTMSDIELFKQKLKKNG